jgi:hypothetical protein
LTPGSAANQQASSAGIVGPQTISGSLGCPLLGFAGATGCSRVIEFLQGCPSKLKVWSIQAHQLLF